MFQENTPGIRLDQATPTTAGSDGDTPFQFYGDPETFQAYCKQNPDFVINNVEYITGNPNDSSAIDLLQDFVGSDDDREHDNPNANDLLKRKPSIKSKATNFLQNPNYDSTRNSSYRAKEEPVPRIDYSNEIVALFKRKETNCTPEDTEQLRVLVQKHISSLVDDSFQKVDSSTDVLRLKQAKTRLLEVLRAFKEKNEIFKTKRAYTVLAKFLNHPALNLSHNAETELSPTEIENTLKTISSLTNSFYAIVYLPDMTVTDLNTELYSGLKLGVELELQKIKEDKSNLIRPEQMILEHLSTMLLIMAAAITIITITAAMIAYSGVTIPAIVLSYTAALQATSWVTQGLGLMTSFIATAGIQATTAQVAAGVAALTVSTFSLFGAAIRPTTLRQNATHAAEQMERSLNLR